MPIKEAAKKAMRQTLKLTHRNRVVKAEIDSLRVLFRKLLDKKEAIKATEIALKVAKKLDKAVARGIVKKNAAARYKSRLMKKLYAVK